jgi:hypothetical protein
VRDDAPADEYPEPGSLERIAEALERIATSLEAHAPRKAPAPEDLPPPLRVDYGADGLNQWGVSYHSRCPSCDSDYPSNSTGDGTCRQCGAVINRRAGTMTVGGSPRHSADERVRDDGPR